MTVSMLAMSACTEKVVIDNIDESRYDNLTVNYGSLVDAKNGMQSRVLEVRQENVDAGLKAVLPRPASKTTKVLLKYDVKAADKYNKQHNTDFDLLPEEYYELLEEEIVIAPGEKVSEEIALSIKPMLQEEEGTYILPLKAVIKGDDVKGSETALIYLVKNLKKQATALRKEGEKHVFCYFEINNTNPLNLLCWEMEDGRLLVDYLVLFAYNIRYNEETKEVYCHANPGAQYILDNYDQVIKPLRDRGVKVIIGLLGDHDPAGLAQLSDMGARKFAAHMASICYGYGFDGINFDDEYSNAPISGNPWFTSHSSAAGNRLIYECKQAMPDLLMTSYQYGSCTGSGAVDGHQPGEYLDITVGDYGRRAVAYTGMTNAQCSYQSSEFALGRALPSSSELSNFRNSDYGFWMMFSAWSVPGNKTDYDRLNTMAQGIYGSKLVKPSYYYPVTRSLETTAITW